MGVLDEVCRKRYGTADLPGPSGFSGPRMAVGFLQSLGLREPAKTGSLFGRFLFFLIPIFVVASMLGLALVSNVFLRAERDSINKRINMFTARMASVLEEEAQRGNGKLSANLVNLLLLDPAIHCV
jgi:hypothetical protein